MLYLMTAQERGEDSSKRIRVLLRQWLRAHPKIPGIVAGMIDGGLQGNGRRHIVALGHAGTAREEVSGETLFEIGSISKALLGSLLARLAAEGTLRLDDPLRRWLPELDGKRGCGEVTLEQLATHTAGLPSIPRQWAFLKKALRHPRDPYAQYTLDEMLDYAAKVRVVPAPAPYVYSNFGYALLGAALERAGGRPLAVLMHTYVFMPAGMVSATYDLASAIVQGLADGHDRKGRLTPPWSLGPFAPAGGIRANATDMLAMLDRARREITPFAVGAASRVISVGNEGDGVGLGWHRLARHHDEIVWHNGGTGGFRSFAGYSEVTGRAVVVLANAAIDVDALALHLLNPAFPVAAAAPSVTRRPFWRHPLLLAPLSIAVVLWLIFGLVTW